MIFRAGKIFQPYKINCFIFLQNVLLSSCATPSERGAAAGGKIYMNNSFKEAKTISGTRRLTGVAILTAIVVILQLLGSFIRFGPFSISLVLVPIVIGAALYGTWAGAWLGCVFGLVVLLSGDAAAFLVVNAPATILVVLAKGTLAGLCAGLVYNAVSGKNETLAATAAAIVCPVVNTGIFLLGCVLFYMETITGWATAAGFENVGKYMIVGFVGLNFVFELLVNVILSPVIIRLIHAGRKIQS